MLNDPEFQDLYAKWAAARLSIPREKIKSVDFGVIYGGYCETCQYETFGATVRLAEGRDEEIEDEATTIIAELLRAAQV